MVEVDTIYNEDCLETFKRIPLESLDLVLTDPPYLKEYLYTYDYLAEYVPPLMKRGGSLITIVGHYALPNVIEKFQGKLKYRWLFCMNQFEGSHARMAMGIEVLWKPCLWYVKESYPQGRGFIKDGFIISGKGGQNKQYHKWEQDLSWAEFFIKKLTKEGDLVFDPFLGSGTVAIACIKNNRHYLGSEISKEYYDIAIKRVSNAERGKLG